MGKLRPNTKHLLQMPVERMTESYLTMFYEVELDEAIRVCEKYGGQEERVRRMKKALKKSRVRAFASSDTWNQMKSKGWRAESAETGFDFCQHWDEARIRAKKTLKVRRVRGWI